MNIAFDAKRLFNNVSGLGNYSRNTLNLLTAFHKEHNYHLFTPYIDERIPFTVPNKVHVHQPNGLWRLGIMSSIWRSTGFAGELDKNKVNIFHGLSNEIPTGLENGKIKTVVTIHDLIFLQYPELYTPVDRSIYTRKFKYAAEHADIVVSVSEFTKQELIHHYQIDENKIRVVYQTCNEAFFRRVSTELKEKVRVKYNLPEEFILSVGTIEKRKNVLNLVKAIHRGNIDTPLVVVGQATNYIQEIEAYINEHQLNDQVGFIHNVANSDLPVLYQLASAFVYISIIEGFGIPVLEAMASGTPVLTTRGTTMEESGGEAYQYVNPNDIDEIAASLQAILGDAQLRAFMLEKGSERAQEFSGKKVISQLNEVYAELA